MKPYRENCDPLQIQKPLTKAEKARFRKKGEKNEKSRMRSIR